MKFGNCTLCKKYKYLQNEGKCPSCLDRQENNDFGIMRINNAVSSISGNKDTGVLGDDKGQIIKIDLKNQKVVSRHSVGKSPISDICYHKGTYFIMTNNGRVIEYDSIDECIRWNKSIHKKIQCDFTVTGTGMFNLYQKFSQNSQNNIISVIQCYDIHNNSKRWSTKVNIKNNNEFGTSIVSDHKNLYIGTNKGQILKCDISSGGVSYSADLNNPYKISSMSISNEKIYCGFSNGEVIYFDKNRSTHNNVVEESLMCYPNTILEMDSRYNVVSGICEPFEKFVIKTNDQSNHYGSSINKRYVPKAVKMLDIGSVYGCDCGSILVR